MGNIIAETEKRRHLYQYRRFLLTTEYECAIISLIVLQESQTQNCILGDNMFITNVDEKELPNILIGQITEKVEPFVLEDTKLKETDIEKIPKESELHKQLVRLVQLRGSLAILPFVIVPRRQYILYSALLISDFWYLFFKPTWFQRSTSNFRWIREDIRAK